MLTATIFLIALVSVVIAMIIGVQKNKKNVSLSDVEDQIIPTGTIAEGEPKNPVVPDQEVPVVELVPVTEKPKATKAVKAPKAPAKSKESK